MPLVRVVHNGRVLERYWLGQSRNELVQLRTSLDQILGGLWLRIKGIVHVGLERRRTRDGMLETEGNLKMFVWSKAFRHERREAPARRLVSRGGS